MSPKSDLVAHDLIMLGRTTKTSPDLMNLISKQDPACLGAGDLEIQVQLCCALYLPLISGWITLLFDNFLASGAHISR